MPRLAELHCHLDGVVDPTMIRDFAAGDEHSKHLATRLEAVYPVTSLERWNNGYEPVVSEFLSPLPERLRLVARAQRDRWSAQGVEYAELFVSRVLGALPDAEQLCEWFSVLAADLSSTAGTEVGLVVCLSRPRLSQNVERLVTLARAGVICGVSLAGDEMACSIRDLREPLNRIRETGIGIEIHAGETGDAEWVCDALEHGRPDRIGHGVRAFEDPKLVEQIAKSGVHLEFCPTSNLRLGIIQSVRDLPVQSALAAGVAFSINTDDPGVFECSLTSEFRLVQDEFGLSDVQLDRIFTDTIRAAFRRKRR
jgi:adenosine deaminase